jgi:Tol biopolymer transport system component
MKALRTFFLIIIAGSFTGCEPTLNTGTISCDEAISASSKTDSKIIFISRRIVNSADWNLMVMNPDGSQQMKLTDLTVRCEKVVVSHSGLTVLFVHYSDDNFYELFSINVDGSNLTLIDKAKRFCGSPDWSDNDSKIVYSKSRNESTDDRDLILFDVSTKNKKTLTDTDNNILGRFSKDNKIAFWCQNNTSNDIYLMDADGSNKQKIIPDASNPVWSPGGKRIAYISKGEINSPQISVSCYDGSNSRQLTSTFLRCPDSGFPNYGNDSPQWSPDGEKIIYESHVADGLPEIYVMNSDGSDQTRLTNTERRNENPIISGDGKLIYFTSNRDLSYSFDIYVMGIDGTNQNPLSKYAGDDGYPVLVTR